MDARSYNVWILARPAPDVPGEWVAHCLDFDVMSQGNSLEHALHMVREAAILVAVEELNAGREPTARRAPEESFQELRGLLERGAKVPLRDAETPSAGSRVTLCATQFELRFERIDSSCEMVPLSVPPFPVAFTSQQLAC
jgi:predicted RNase H-like HicB family nuclease